MVGDPMSEERLNWLEGPGQASFQQEEGYLLRDACREIRRLREDNQRLREEKKLSFDSMVGHHETETAELKKTIAGHEEAMSQTAEFLLELRREVDRLVRAENLIRRVAVGASLKEEMEALADKLKQPLEKTRIRLKEKP